MQLQFNINYKQNKLGFFLHKLNKIFIEIYISSILYDNL
jgi:hypothetical protein